MADMDWQQRKNILESETASCQTYRNYDNTSQDSNRPFWEVFCINGMKKVDE
jgi:hypothetical protein